MLGGFSAIWHQNIRKAVLCVILESSAIFANSACKRLIVHKVQSSLACRLQVRNSRSNLLRIIFKVEIIGAFPLLRTQNSLGSTQSTACTCFLGSTSQNTLESSSDYFNLSSARFFIKHTYNFTKNHLTKIGSINFVTGG